MRARRPTELAWATLRSWREPLLVFGVCLVLAVIATWPLAEEARDHVVGDQGGQAYCVGTPNLNVWAMGFVLHQLPRDPLHLFDGNAFYPYKQTLALSEHLFVPALLAAPALLATGNLVLAYNFMSLVTLALAGLGMFLLARQLTGDSAAAFAAGVLYAFHSFNVNELVRVQTLSNEWFPFLLLALILYFETPTRKRAALVGSLYLLQSLSGMYWALYAPLVVFPVVALLEWRHRRPLRELWPLATALFVALLVVGAFAIPYVQTARELDLSRPEPHSQPAALYFRTLPGNLMYGSLLAAGEVNEGASHFTGFIALALALLAFARRGHGASLPGLRPFLVGTCVLAFLLSLGPEIAVGGLAVPGPYAALRSFVPGFGNVRYPERFSILFMLALGPLVAAGLQRLRPRLGGAGLIALAFAIFAENLAIPLGLAYLPTGAEVPAVYRWLARQDEVDVIAEVPSSRYRGERGDGISMYFSTFHWKRTLQGYTGYFPPTYQYMKWRLAAFPAPETLDFLERFGVRGVVVSPVEGAPAAWVTANPRWDVVGPFPEGHVLLKLRSTGLAHFAAPESSEAGLEEVSPADWKVEASEPDPGLALDRNRSTTWNPEPGKRGQPVFIRIKLGKPVEVARVTIQFRSRRRGFPTRIEIAGAGPDGSSERLLFDRRAAYDGLLSSLLFTPLEPRLDLDVEPTLLSTLVLREPPVGLGGRDGFDMRWNVAEIRVFSRRTPRAGG